MTWILAGVSIVALVYIIRYYILKNNLNKASEQMEQIRQNFERNQILRLAAPDKTSGELLKTINNYILLMRKQMIAAKNRETDIRNQIENISHDLRTPLTAIIGYIEIIDRDKLEAADLEMLIAAEQKAHFLLILVNNFYDLSRLELNDYKLNLEEIELSRLIKENTLGFYPEFEKANLTVSFDEIFPKCSIIGDKIAFERILNNMMQNALRYAQTFLKISLVEDNDKIKVIFENDTGVLNENDVTHLFDRFYVKDKSRNGKSSGLGLTVNKILTEKMNGTVSAEIKGNILSILYEFAKS